jgi:hypothetical protein
MYSAEKGCWCCGRPHCANYPRAPRGGSDYLPEEYHCRFSFYCDRDGRTRTFTAAAADTGRGFPDSTDTEPDHVVDVVDPADTGRGFPDSM